MALRDKANEAMEPDLRPQPRANVEREVRVSHAVEGPVNDTEPHIQSPAEQSTRRTRHGHSERSQRRRRRLRLALVMGAIVLAAAPSFATPGRGGEVSIFTLAGSMLALKGITTLVALGAVTWRLRRHASGLRRFGYFVGIWSMAVGVGIVAARAFPLAGTLVFDAGVLALFVLLLGDDRLRGERTPLAAA